MISDVLSDACASIDEYLEDDFYDGEVRQRILAVRTAMGEMQAELDDRVGAPRPVVDLLMAVAAVRSEA